MTGIEIASESSDQYPAQDEETGMSPTRSLSRQDRAMYLSIHAQQKLGRHLHVPQNLNSDFGALLRESNHQIFQVDCIMEHQCSQIPGESF